MYKIRITDIVYIFSELRLFYSDDVLADSIFFI